MSPTASTRKKAKPGPKAKPLSRKVRNTILDAMTSGQNRTQAAAAGGISAKRLRIEISRFPTFARKVEEAMADHDRHRKLDEKMREEYLDLLRNGQRRLMAARIVGIDRKTIWTEMQTDPGFAKAVRDAELEANEQVEDALYNAAVSGNVTAIQVWLYNRAPGDWSDKRVAPIKLASGVGTDGQTATEQEVVVAGEDLRALLRDPAARAELAALADATDEQSDVG